MQKKLTITISEELYKGLYAKIGPRNISRFLEDVARPHILDQELDMAYTELAGLTDREQEALDWSEATLAGLDDATSQ